MKHVLWLFCLFSFSLQAAQEKKIDVVDKSALQQALRIPYVYESVNVVTGEYAESQADLTLTSSHPLQVKRCYLSQDPFQQGWHFNQPHLLEKTGELCSEVVMPGKKMVYLYDGEKRLTDVKTLSPSTAQVINWLKIAYEGDQVRVDSSDGQQVIYKTHVFKDSRIGPIPLIDEMIMPKSRTKYSYIKHPIQRMQLICRKEDDDGSFLETEYYDSVNNAVGDAIVVIKDPLKDWRIGRVKLQKAPLGTDKTPIIKNRLIYHQGATECYDALNHKTIYRYNPQNQITVAEFYKDDGSLYRVAKNHWIGPFLFSQWLEDGKGRVERCVTFDYDAEGRLIRQTLHGNLTGKGEAIFTIGENGKPKGNGIESYSLAYSYNSDNLLNEKSEDNGSSIRYLYDPVSKLPIAEFTCFKGKICLRRFYEYDKEGLIIKTIVDDGCADKINDLTQVSMRKIGRITPSYEVLSYGLPLIVEDGYLDLESGSEKIVSKTLNFYSEKGVLERQETYDANGSLTQGQKEKADSEVRYEYDFAKRIIRIEELTKKEAQSTSFRYDFLGNRTQTIDAFGNATDFSYDEFGRCVKTVYPSVLDEHDRQIKPFETKEYDICDRVIKAVDPNGYPTLTRYNARGKPIEIRYPDQTVECFEYNLDGTLCKTIGKNGMTALSQTDGLKRIVMMELYSPSGELLSRVETVYNGFHPVLVKDGSGSVIVYHYDSSGDVREVLQIGQDGRKRQVSPHVKADQPKLSKLKIDKIETDLHEEIAINSLGQCVAKKTLVDAQGRATWMLFDALGRLETVAKQNALGEIVFKKEMRYDGAGNKTLEINTCFKGNKGSADHKTKWTYGPLNRLEEVIEGYQASVQQRTSYLYDHEGRLASIIKPDGTQILHNYDSAGNLCRLSSSDGSVNYQYYYDKQNQATQAIDLNLNTSCHKVYNSFNQLQSEILANGLEIANSYDDSGRLASLILPDGSKINYIYDGGYLKEIERLSKNGEKKYSHCYESVAESGKPITARLAKDVGKITLSYDSERRCRSIETPFWSESIPEGGYDASGNINRIIIHDSAGKYESVFSYDSNRQLASEKGEFSHDFEHDSLFNRIKQDGVDVACDELFQIQSKGAFAYQHDLNGNLVSCTGPNREIHYRYDALNRLVEVQLSKNEKISYLYDPFHRVIKTVEEEWDSRQNQWIVQKEQKHFYQGDLEIGSTDPKNNMNELRVLGLGLGAEIGASVAFELDGKVLVPIHDHRGSVSCLIDADSKDVVECYRYSAFGELRVFSANGNRLERSIVNNPWGFSGKRFYQKAGLNSFGKRFYDPSLGRWMTKDPLGFIDGPNRYAFVGNNPLTNVDLFGHFSFSEFFGSLLTQAMHAMTKIGAFLEQWHRQFNPGGLSYFNYIRPEVESFTKSVIGTTSLIMMGYWNDPVRAATYGEGEAHDKVRITMINGILNLRKHCVETAQFISQTHGNVNVHYIYRPTAGWAADLMNAFLVKCGYISPAARHLADIWKMLIQEMGGTNEGGMIIHYAHSIGGKETAMARSLLSSEEQKMIRVVSMGSASAIPNGGFESVINYMSVRDGIWLLDPVGYIGGMFSKESNITYMGTLWGIPMIDHSFSSGSYAALLALLGRQFVETYKNVSQ